MFLVFFSQVSASGFFYSPVIYLWHCRSNQEIHIYKRHADAPKLYEFNLCDRFQQLDYVSRDFYIANSTTKEEKDRKMLCLTVITGKV